MKWNRYMKWNESNKFMFKQLSWIRKTAKESNSLLFTILHYSEAFIPGLHVNETLKNIRLQQKNVSAVIYNDRNQSAFSRVFQ